MAAPAGDKTITIPYQFTPRVYQIPALRAHANGAKRIVNVWHRRSGKDKTWWNRTIQCALVERVGTYFYAYPTYTQAKLAIWDGRDKSGFPYLGHVPRELLRSKNETELSLEFVNGSIVRLVGTDNINSLMSSNPVGVVLSEYSLQNPDAWNYLRPILLENNGWASFIYTPRGKNHGFEMFELAKRMGEEKHPDWYVDRLTVNDTHVVSSKDIDDERRAGMDEELIQQEYFCSFEGAMQGSYYGREMNAAESEGRVCSVPVQSGVPVDTWWDLGVADAMSIWFTQNIGREVHVVDYYEETGVGLPAVARVLQDRGYLYGIHNAPHDIKVREIGTDGVSRIETARKLGINFEIVDNIPRQDGIDAVRRLLAICFFDRVKTERGRLALVSYRKKYDTNRKTFSAAPLHDWSSNGADAFRMLGVGHRFRADLPKPPVYVPTPLRVTSPDGWMAL